MTNPAEQNLFRQGLSLYKTGRYQEASELFLQIATQEKDNHKAWNALGVSLSKAGDRKNAVLCFENALALDPDNATYKKNLAGITRTIPGKKKNVRSKGKQTQNKSRKKPITSYVLAVGGVLFAFVIIMVTIAVIAGLNSSPQPAIQPAQTTTPSTQPVILIPTAEITPSETYLAPGPVTMITPSQGNMTSAVMAEPTTQATIQGSIPLTARFLDVGQGDSILLQAGGKNLLIDAGPVSAGSSVVSSLKSAGVTTLDVIVATCPLDDHIGGMVDVLNSFPVNLYADSGATYTTTTYANVMSTLRADQIPHVEVKTGNTIPFTTGVDVQVLGPANLSGDLMKDAIVLKVTDGSHAFLFMADTPDVPGDIRAQILKVSHHGSATGTSSGFLTRVKPEVAIIEVGTGNDHGYPDSATLLNLQQAGVKVYRTDTDGTITVATFGPALQVTTHKVVTPVLSTPGTTLTPVQAVNNLPASINQG